MLNPPISKANANLPDHNCAWFNFSFALHKALKRRCISLENMLVI